MRSLRCFPVLPLLALTVFTPSCAAWEEFYDDWEEFYDEWEEEEQERWYPLPAEEENPEDPAFAPTAEEAPAPLSWKEWIGVGVPLLWLGGTQLVIFLPLFFQSYRKAVSKTNESPSLSLNAVLLFTFVVSIVIETPLRWQLFCNLDARLGAGYAQEGRLAVVLPLGLSWLAILVQKISAREDGEKPKRGAPWFWLGMLGHGLQLMLTFWQFWLVYKILTQTPAEADQEEETAEE